MNIKKWVKDHWLHLAIGGAAVVLDSLNGFWECYAPDNYSVMDAK